MNATAVTMTNAPATIAGVIGSPRKSAPRITATTGFTNAYVATSDTGACCSSQVYAVKATMEPNTTRYASATSDRTEKLAGSRCAASPRTTPTTPSADPPARTWPAVESRPIRAARKRGDTNVPIAQALVARTGHAGP